jgi:hypothetical protein
MRQLYRAPGLALPICVWNTDRQVTGDASGGTVTLSCTTNRAVTGKYVWSVEEVNISNNDATARAFANTWSYASGIAAGSSSMIQVGATVATPAAPGIGFGALAMRTARTPGTGLQALSRVLLVQLKTNLLSLNTVFDNADTIVFGQRAWGYCWDADRLRAGDQLVRPDG